MHVVCVGTVLVVSAVLDAETDECRSGDSACHVGFIQMSAFTKEKGASVPTTAANSTSTVTSFVSKKQFSSDVRFLFVAGVEGTGHHGWQDALETCGKCVFLPEVSCLLWNELKDKDSLFPALLRSKKPDIELILQHRVVDALRTAQEQHNDSLIILNAFEDETVTGRHKECYTGMMSYPNFNGPDKALQRPDIQLLAQLAELAEVDLRVLVLLRPAEQILASTVDNRHFETENREGLFLADNAQALNLQLSRIDPEFMMCFDPYDRVDSVFSTSGKLRLGGFLHPTFNTTDEGKKAWLDEIGVIRPGDPTNITAQEESQAGGFQTVLGKLVQEMSSTTSFCSDTGRLL